MKVSAFARWLDLQNRMSLKEVQAVLGSLKYSRTAPVDVVVFDHVLDYLQAKNKKWSDERLVMIDMKPPPQPKKKVEAPAKNGAVVMAEALYQATYEDVLRLVPKHLAQNRPVVLCGGINVITGPGKPDFFACKNFQVYSPREPDQPNDAFSSYRASLRALLFDPSAP